LPPASPSRPCLVASSLVLLRPPPLSPLFPYTTLFRSRLAGAALGREDGHDPSPAGMAALGGEAPAGVARLPDREDDVLGQLRERSEEHTSELQSRVDLVCRLLLAKKKTRTKNSGIDAT